MYTGGSTGTVNISDSSVTRHVLNGLVNDEYYEISIRATSKHFHSTKKTTNIDLGKSQFYIAHT